MCGIAGWADPFEPLTCGDRRVGWMVDALVEREGDGGAWGGPHAALGRPVVLAGDGGVALLVLSFSGEVVNRVALRGELELLGHKFRDGGDAEVVLHACREWGTGVAERLDGVFAFGAWDAARRRLVLVRDRLGVWPLCYAEVGTGVVFASEPEALFASGLVGREVDPRDFFASVCTPGSGLFRGVREVPPGGVLVVDGGGVREHRYWALAARPVEGDVVERTRELLVDVTARVEEAAGVLLSAGVESGVLEALLPGRRTFSADGSPCPFREDVEVVVSAAGADEVFGGHAWFHDPNALAAADYPWPPSAHQALLRADVAAELDLVAHRAEHYRQALAEVPVLPGEGALQRRTREVSHLCLTRWLPDVLDHHYRLGADAGLVVRLPFCDQRVVEHAFNTPWSLHTADGRPKSVLRAAFPTSAVPRRRVRRHGFHEQIGDLLATPAAPVWDYLDPALVRARSSGLDFVLSFDVWLRSSGRRGSRPGPCRTG